MKEKCEDFMSYCKMHIRLKLFDYQGTTHYACDLAYALCENENRNGTLTFGRTEAIEYIREWWFDCAEYYDYEKFNYGEHLYNPFESPEEYMVCMVIAGVGSILSQCPSIDDAWNNKIELTEEFISQLQLEIDKVNIIW